MEIKNSKFLKSITKLEDKPTGDVPEIAFVGKSNVGKSSLINNLLSHKIAKTSSAPGRTRLINYFAVNNDTLRFVDLPGYGYNLASKQISNEWDNMIGKFLLDNPNLKLVIFLVDCRHNPTNLDKQTQKFLYNNGIPFLTVATKTDKIAKSKVNNQLFLVAKELMISKSNIIAYSVENNVGKANLLEKIDTILENIC